MLAQGGTQALHHDYLGPFKRERREQHYVDDDDDDNGWRGIKKKRGGNVSTLTHTHTQIQPGRPLSLSLSLSCSLCVCVCVCSGRSSPSPSVRAEQRSCSHAPFLCRPVSVVQLGWEVVLHLFGQGQEERRRKKCVSLSRSRRKWNQEDKGE